MVSSGMSTAQRSTTPIREYSGLDDEAVRREVIGAERPAVLRGYVRGWPIVAAARDSPAAVARYLARFDRGAPVDAVMTPPEVEGRIFYNEALSGFNFVRNRLPISAVAEQVLRYGAFPRPPAVAVQSALLRDCLPGFTEENELTLLPAVVLPRIWLGNAITTPTHVDEWNNVGCVVSGRRRYTLFPPEQVANLYVGPLDFAPTGAPMSLVSLRQPDLGRFPKFRAALAAAQTAELRAGDAIYIPPLWWHHVESLESFNVLVNYWWHGSPADPPQDLSAFDCLLHAIVNLRQLPPETRRAWRALFDHYVFGPQQGVTDHIPRERLGMLSRLSSEERARLRGQLVLRLQK
jgi:hypothetical protein